MFISDFAIKRPLVTVVMMVALVVFGAAALMMLKTDEYPDVAPPFVSVGVVYPGASPDGVESEILTPIEEQIRSIAGVKQVQGYAYDGYGLMVVEFQFEKDLGEATQEIRDNISSIRSELPPEMKEPIIKKLNDTDTPIVSMALSSTVLSPAEMTRLADPGITRELRSLPGVAEVKVFGTQERELTVQLKPAALQASKVSVGEVVQALQLQNLAVPVGRVQGAFDERSIRLKGRLEGPQEFAQLVVAERNGTLVRLGQVADVIDGTEEPRTIALFNATEAVGIDVKKSKGYSTTDVSDRVRARVAELQKDLPAGTKLELVRDAGTRVDYAVKNVQSALVEGAILTVLVVFIFLNSWRSTVITGVALPISVLASFIAVWAMGFKLETMSLLGLSLAIGILIDDAIVVRENIVRHVEMGKDHFTAAREGTDEIGLAVAATTFSILAVFVPIGFMPGIGGQWFKPFALTIACSVFVSLFVSFSLDPMLSAYWPDPHKQEHEKAWITKKLDVFNNWFNRQANAYRRVIAWALDHRIAMFFLATGSMVVAMAMPFLGLVGGEFLPEDDRAELNIQLETPPGSNLQYTRLKAEEAGRIARAHPEVRYTYITLGDQTSGSVDVGNIYVRMTPKNTRKKSVAQLGEELREETKRVAGVTLSVFISDFGGGRKTLQIQVIGSGDNAALNRAADQVLAELKQVPGAVDIGLSTKGQKPELNVELNRGVAGSMGVTVGQVAQALRPAFAGVDVGDWKDPSGETRNVEVRLVPESRRRPSDLEQLPISVIDPSTGAPATMPLGQVAKITESVGPAIINHLDGDQVVFVQSNVAGRSSGEVNADIKSRLEKLQLPPGVRWEMGGEAKDQAEVFGQIFFALGVAILLMYLILVVQFGSFLDPLAILVSLPLSMIGVMLGLVITGNTINIMSMIAIILLAGIVAKNAILLIDFAKWAREEQGMHIREALIEAGAIRLRPILMTTFALIAGMVPVALGRGEGAQFRAPMGIAVIGGVVTSTILTLVVIPTVYEVLDETRRWFGSKFGFKPKQMTAEHPAGKLPVPVHAGD
jgi:hydrophobic/amphiphilic exporter-1 (mainly G- bacteria), HAE1 family